MALSDPTSGAGYAFGEKLPSAHMTTIATQAVRALDAVLGGSWALGANATLTGAGELRPNHLRLPAGGSSFIDHAVEIATAIAVTWKGTTNWPKVDSRDVWRPVPLKLVFGPDYVFASGRWDQNSIAGTAEQAWFEIPPYDGAQLIGIRVWLTGSAGHPNLTNVTLPNISLHKVVMDGTVVQVASSQVTDPSADATAYQTLHPITSSAFTAQAAHDASAGVRYLMRVSGEDGTAAIAGMRIESAAAQWRFVDIRS